MKTSESSTAGTIRNDNKDKPSSSSRRSWRREEKENSTPKSHGISVESFHRKRAQEKSKEIQDFKETIETNLLIQNKELHAKALESRRKAFRNLTCLKTWPLQDMAMEHLDFLLLGKDSNSQFHGGDYLSSESSSSIESMEQKRRVSPSKTKEQQQQRQEYIQEFQNSKEPLWSQEPRIFATEKAQGKRKYLVGHFGRIADWYWRKANLKHLYEVIRENTPCRLYFDLEFSKVYNPNVDQIALLKEFQQELIAEFQDHYQIDLDAKQIIDLDSSTDVKFSRHWMLDIPGCLFEDAPTAGRFVKRVVSRLAEELATGQLAERCPELAKHLFVNTKEEGKTSCFIDLGVYTRNRLFRVFGSSKFGKKASLELAQENEYPIDLPSTKAPNQHVSLEDYIAANNWEPHARILADTLVVPLSGNSHGVDDVRILKVDNDEFAGPFRGGPNSNNNKSGKKYNASIPMRTSVAPLPSLDKHVGDVLANRGGTLGSIRAWSVEYGPRDVPVSISYQLSRNRYCELIGRSHKSNNIFWTVDLTSWTCIQGCHDPECFGRGSPIPVPSHLVSKLQEELEAWQEEEFEKALLALNIEDECKKVKEAEEEKSKTDKASSTLVRATRTSEGGKSTLPDVSNDGDLDAGTFLSDADILKALESNPELFP